MVDMSQFLVAAEMIYWKEGGYDNVSCAHLELISLCDNVKDQTGKEPIIHSSSEVYCIYAELPGGKYYCLDNSKFRLTETTTFPGDPGYCDGLIFICP